MAQRFDRYPSVWEFDDFVWHMVPKVASETLRDLFATTHPGMKGAFSVEGRHKPQYAAVRHPVSRFLSAVAYFESKRPEFKLKPAGLAITPDVSIDLILDCVKESKDPHFTPQYRFIPPGTKLLDIHKLDAFFGVELPKLNAATSKRVPTTAEHDRIADYYELDYPLFYEGLKNPNA